MSKSTWVVSITHRDGDDESAIKLHGDDLGNLLGIAIRSAASLNGDSGESPLEILQELIDTLRSECDGWDTEEMKLINLVVGLPRDKLNYQGLVDSINETSAFLLDTEKSEQDNPKNDPHTGSN